MTNENKKQGKYKDIAKSTGMVGMIQIFQMGFGLLRNKLVAILLGTGGFGIWSLYQTFITMTSSFSSLGLDQSGVREIAKHSNDEFSVGKCIWVFRRAILLISLIVSLFIIIFAENISLYLFNSTDYKWGVRFISIIIFGEAYAKGGYAVLNGLRQLKILAKSQILSYIIGSISAILLIFIFKEDGIPIALGMVTFTLAVITWIYIRKLKIKEYLPQRKEAINIFKPLLTLGLGFTIAGITAAFFTLCSRMYLNTHYDINAVGIYQASWTIANLYIGVILSAMGVDFMPRLSKTKSDREMTTMVQDQLDFSMLLASIGVSGILIFTPFILQLLYSSEFLPGSSIIRWHVLGVGMRVLAFPFSYVIMAKGKALLYAITQIIFWGGEFCLLILFSSLFGFDGLGVNYCIGYMGYLIMTCIASRFLCGFKFSKQNFKIISITWGFIALAWFCSYFFSGATRYFIGTGILLLHAFIIHWCFKKYLSINILSFLKRLIKK